MKKLWAVGILVGLVALTVTSCATAKDMKGKFGIGGNIGYALMDIKGVNEWLDVLEERTATIMTAWTTTAKDHLKGDMTYLGEIRYGITSNLMLAVLGGSMSSEGKYAATGPSEVEFNDKVSATFLGGGALYILPLRSENLNMFLRGGVDSYTVKYKERFTENISVEERRAEGSKIGFHVGGGLEAFLGENIAIGLNVLYRIAKLSELETKKDDGGLSAEGDPLEVFSEPDWSDSKTLEIDLSGLNVYLTLYFYF